MTAVPHLTVVPQPPPDFRRVGLDYEYTPDGSGLTFKATFIKRSSDFEVSARVEVTSTRADMRPYLIGARFNLSTAYGRKQLTEQLKDRSERAGDGVEWRSLVEAFCVAVERAEARGGRFRKLGPQALEGRRADIVHRLIPAGKIAIFYGPPGVGKGYLEVALAICIKLGLPFCGLPVQQGEPLIIDYEDDEETMLERVQAVAWGMGLAVAPSICWWKPRGLLKHSVHELAEIVAREGITVAFLDSVGPAGGSPGEHGSHETVALDLAEACSAVQQVADHALSWAWIDHVSAAGAAEKLAGKPMNSYRKVMTARVTWEMRNVQEQGARDFTVALYHEKHNHTERYAPVVLRVEFDNDADGRPLAARFKRTELHEYPELASRDEGGLKGRIVYALSDDGPARTIKALADALDADPVQVGNRLRELKAAGRAVDFGGGRGQRGGALWSLKAGNTQINTPIEKDPVVYLGDGSTGIPSPPNTTPVDFGNQQPVHFNGPPAPPPGTGRLPYADDDQDDLDDSPFEEIDSAPF